MGTSNWQNLSFCVDLIRYVSPKSVLDVGVGFGRWGMICREYLMFGRGAYSAHIGIRASKGLKSIRSILIHIIPVSTISSMLRMHSIMYKRRFSQDNSI